MITDGEYSWKQSKNSDKLHDHLIIDEVAMMSLTTKMKQQLKGVAHKLKPVIMIGNNGLTEAVNKEIDRALQDHELIKIRIQTHDRERRRELFQQICQTNQAELVQTIGSIGVVYRLRKAE